MQHRSSKPVVQARSRKISAGNMENRHARLLGPAANKVMIDKEEYYDRDGARQEGPHPEARSTRSRRKIEETTSDYEP